MKCWESIIRGATSYRKLSQADLAKKREEMMANAKRRFDEVEANVRRYRAEDAEEESRVTNQKEESFIK